ncbi:polyadenylate-binding protein B-binding protein [Salix suchowensis]|nr:polyadenylate-binding protein B-binding protein [Salix suchowensis]
MDREQEEMQFLGVFGMYKEAYKIILSWRKIFKELDETQVGTKRYEKISDMLSSEWAYFWLFKAAYFTFLLIFSLLSTAAVVYTIACIYTAREVTFKKVMSVVPKVWKRLMITFLSIFIAVFLYNVVSILVLITCVFLIDPSPSNILPILVVVSVLEEASGIKAMKKSRELLKGKMWVAIIIFFKLNLSSIGLHILFENNVVHGWSLGILYRGSFGILSLLLLLMLFLFGLVIQTVIYFVCKSYHHENIDKSALSDHLEVYMGEYVPLKSKDVQLQHFEV